MERVNPEKTVGQRKAFFCSKGVTYFDKKTERSIFFILTIAMLVWGMFESFGFLTG